MLRGTFLLIQPFSERIVVSGKFDVLDLIWVFWVVFPLKGGCGGLKMTQNEFLREVGASSQKSLRKEKMPYDNTYPAKKELGQNSRRCSSYSPIARGGGGVGVFCIAVVALSYTAFSGKDSGSIPTKGIIVDPSCIVLLFQGIEPTPLAIEG